MVDRRENEAQSDQMKADGRGIERTSGPFRANMQKNLTNQSSSQKTLLSRSAPKYTVVETMRDHFEEHIKAALEKLSRKELGASRKGLVVRRMKPKPS